MRTLRLLLDMDGPLADFDLAFWELCRGHGVEMNITSMDDPNRKRFMTDNILRKDDRNRMREFVDHGPNRWFRDLPVVSGCQEGVERLEEAGVDIWICTKPLESNWRCRDDKAKWIRRYFPHLEDKLLIMPNKALAIGDVLLDDAPKTKWFGEAVWKPVIFPCPFNGEGSEWEGLPRWTWGDPIEDLLAYVSE